MWGKGQEPGWPQRVLPRALQVLQLRPDPPFPPPSSAPVAVLLAGWVPQGSWAVTKDTAGHAWLRALGEQAPSPPSSGLSPHPPSLNTLISLALSTSAQPSLPPPHPAQCPGQEGSWGSSGNSPQSAESRREPAHPCWGRGAGGLGGQPGLLSPRPPGRAHPRLCPTLDPGSETRSRLRRHSSQKPQTCPQPQNPVSSQFFPQHPHPPFLIIPSCCASPSH